MAAMIMVSARGFSGVSFHLSKCPQGVASVLCKKTPIFGSRRSKLDDLTVLVVVWGSSGHMYGFQSDVFIFDVAVLLY
jgi:hypothetical protein